MSPLPDPDPQTSSTQPHGESGGAVRAASWPGYLLFGMACVALHAVLIRYLVPQVMEGTLLDTDSYTRLIRVGLLAETGAWYDTVIPRMNVPFGLALHWTRPMDVLLLAGAWTLLPFADFPSALYWSGVFATPVLQVGACLAIAWAAAPLMDHRGRLLAMIALLAQPVVTGYSLAGRADHHTLQALIYIVALGWTVRASVAPGRLKAAVAAGAAAGLGLWVSVEFLLPLASLFGALGLLAVVVGRDWARASLAAAAGLVLVVGLAVLLEHPPSQLLLAEYDRISAPHLLLSLAVLVTWGLVLTLDQALSLRSPAQRLAATTASLVATALPLLLVYPRLLHNPMADMDAQVWELYMTSITELQPLLPSDARSLGKAIAYLGPGLAALPFAAWQILRRPRSSRAHAWLPVGLGLLAFLPLSLYQVRFGLWAGVVFALGIAGILASLFVRVDGLVSPAWRATARVGASAALIPGFLLVGGSIMSSGAPGATPADRFKEGPCTVRDLADALNGEFWRDPVRTVLMVPDFGPEIVYRTPHSVVGAPYHRIASAILDTYRVLVATEDESSRQLVAARGVDLVVLCPAHDRGFFGRAPQPSATLYERLVGGNPPRWLEARALPGEAGQAFMMFEVVNPSVSASPRPSVPSGS